MITYHIVYMDVEADAIRFVKEEPHGVNNFYTRDSYKDAARDLKRWRKSSSVDYKLAVRESNGDLTVFENCMSETKDKVQDVAEPTTIKPLWDWLVRR